MFSKVERKPLIWCGTSPRGWSPRSSLLEAEAGAAGHCGCWRSDTSSSTNRADAIAATPGRVTVHCWSSVWSLTDCKKNKLPSKYHIHGTDYLRPLVQQRHCRSSNQAQTLGQNYLGRHGAWPQMNRIQVLHSWRSCQQPSPLRLVANAILVYPWEGI